MNHYLLAFLMCVFFAGGCFANQPVDSLTLESPYTIDIDSTVDDATDVPVGGLVLVTDASSGQPALPVTDHNTDPTWVFGRSHRDVALIFEVAWRS